MRWSVGVIAAPRPDGVGLEKTVACLNAAGWGTPWVFAEPGTLISDNVISNAAVISRPHRVAELRQGIVPHESGKLGNVQHWIQTACDLLADEPSADAYVTVEDDALVCRGAKEFVETLLWPSHRCGAISLYCANSPENRKPVPQLFQSRRQGILGTLFMIWRPECLADLAEAEFLSWKGGNPTKKTPIPQHDWKGVDTWLGLKMIERGWETWMLSPSLVYHYEPHGKHSYSAVGNGKALGKRQAFRFVGMEPNLKQVFRSMLARNPVKQFVNPEGVVN